MRDGGCCSLFAHELGCCSLFAHELGDQPNAPSSGWVARTPRRPPMAIRAAHATGTADRRRVPTSRTTFDAVGLSLFPIDVPEGVALSDMFMGVRRFGAPMVFGGTGTEIESQEAVRMVAFEWPTAYTLTVEKTAKELQHLNRFNVDIRAETRRPLYSSIQQVEDDPPDFRCITQDGRTRGVECTQLVLQERLEAEARFRRLRRALLGTSRHRLQHLQGHVVYVALEPRSAGQRQPKLSELVRALISGLEQHDPTIGATLTELPEQAPRGDRHQVRRRHDCLRAAERRSRDVLLRHHRCPAGVEIGVWDERPGNG